MGPHWPIHNPRSSSERHSSNLHLNQHQPLVLFSSTDHPPFALVALSPWHRHHFQTRPCFAPRMGHRTSLAIACTLIPPSPHLPPRHLLLSFGTPPSNDEERNPQRREAVIVPPWLQGGRGSLLSLHDAPLLCVSNLGVLVFGSECSRKLQTGIVKGGSRNEQPAISLVGVSPFTLMSSS